MAAATATVTKGKTISVDANGVIVSFPDKKSSIFISNAVESANPVAYDFKTDITAGSAPANDTALRALDAGLLEPGDDRGRDGLNIDKVYLRCATGGTASVRVEI